MGEMNSKRGGRRRNQEKEPERSCPLMRYRNKLMTLRETKRWIAPSRYSYPWRNQSHGPRIFHELVICYTLSSLRRLGPTERGSVVFRRFITRSVGH